MTQPWRWLAPMWMYHATIGLANTAAWGACLLAAALAVRRAHDSAAYSLALFLSLGAAAYGLWSAEFAIAALGSVWATRAAHAALVTCALFASVASLRFSAFFPRPLDIDVLRAAFSATLSGKEPVLRDSWGTAGERIGYSIKDRIAKLQPNNPIARLAEKRSRMLQKMTARDRSNYMKSVERVHRWLLAPGNAWQGAAGLAVVIIVLSMVGWTLAASVLVMYAGLMAWVMGLTHMRLSYAVCSDEERRRALWVVEGFLLALAPGVVVEAVLMPLVMINVPVTEWFMGSYVLAAASGAIALVICLAIAIFHSGSFDAALVIRRTTVYSAIVVILTGAFAAVENVVTNAIAARTALPANTGAMIAAVVVALAFGPLRDKLKALVERRMPSMTGGAASTREA